MKPTEVNTNIVDNYYVFLKNLSHDNKLEIIARLSSSLKTGNRAKDKSWMSLSGALTLDKPVDKFVEELKNDRHFNNESFEL